MNNARLKRFPTMIPLVDYVFPDILITARIPALIETFGVLSVRTLGRP